MKRFRFGGANLAPFFAFVGVLRYYKGLHILPDAAKNLDCQIVIVGAGPIEQRLKTKAVQSGSRMCIF